MSYGLSPAALDADRSARRRRRPGRGAAVRAGAAAHPPRRLSVRARGLPSNSRPRIRRRGSCWSATRPGVAWRSASRRSWRSGSASAPRRLVLLSPVAGPDAEPPRPRPPYARRDPWLGHRWGCSRPAGAWARRGRPHRRPPQPRQRAARGPAADHAARRHPGALPARTRCDFADAAASGRGEGRPHGRRGRRCTSTRCCRPRRARRAMRQVVTGGRRALTQRPRLSAAGDERLEPADQRSASGPRRAAGGAERSRHRGLLGRGRGAAEVGRQPPAVVGAGRLVGVAALRLVEQGLHRGAGAAQQRLRLLPRLGDDRLAEEHGDRHAAAQLRPCGPWWRSGARPRRRPG